MEASANCCQRFCESIGSSRGRLEALSTCFKVATSSTIKPLFKGGEGKSSTYSLVDCSAVSMWLLQAVASAALGEAVIMGGSNTSGERCKWGGHNNRTGNKELTSIRKLQQRLLLDAGPSRYAQHVIAGVVQRDNASVAASEGEGKRHEAGHGRGLCEHEQRVIGGHAVVMLPAGAAGHSFHK